MTDGNSFQFRTKMWQRSPNSYASTIPQNILAITNAPTPTDDTEVYLTWEINENGEITIDFETEPIGDDD